MSKKRYVYFLYKPNRDAENQGVYHYVSESFYTVLWNPNLPLEEIYHTKENLLKGHLIVMYNQNVDQRGVRLFYFNNVCGDLITDEMIAPRTEIKLYMQMLRMKITRIIY